MKKKQNLDPVMKWEILKNTINIEREIGIPYYARKKK